MCDNKNSTIAKKIIFRKKGSRPNFACLYTEKFVILTFIYSLMLSTAGLKPPNEKSGNLNLPR